MSSEEFPFVWNSWNYITLNWESTRDFIRIPFILKLINLRNLKLRNKVCLRKNSLLFSTQKLIQLQTEKQEMSSSESAFVWNTSTYITSNWESTNVFITIRFCLKLVNLDNFKLRLNKCLHQNSLLFETHKLT